jgi:hypothetical protein
MKPIAQVLEERLFADEGAQVYAILDGASVEGLVPRLAEAAEYVCLYAGELKPDMQAVAPYLIRLERGAPFTAWILEEGWGKHWGVFAAGAADLRALRLHFRRFLLVHDSNGKPLVFRYYDPRVLRTYLPTCNAEELDTVFGPVTHFYAEGEDPGELLCFRRAGGKLVVGATALAV